jgi:hypothetical protein
MQVMPWATNSIEIPGGRYVLGLVCTKIAGLQQKSS